jgi:hypothetical protein
VLAELFSTLYSGRVGKAKAVLRNSGCSGNIIDIYILQLESNNQLKTANSILKHQLQSFLEQKKMLTDFICIKDAAQVFQDISINVNISKFLAQFKKDVFEQVQSAVDSFFDLSRWSIAQPLKKADLIQHLNSIQDVSSVDVIFTKNNQNLLDSEDDVLVDFWKIIRNGNVSINVNIVD